MSAPANSADSFVVGRSLALSGPRQSYGEAKRDGGNADIRKVNAAGGVGWQDHRTRDLGWRLRTVKSCRDGSPASGGGLQRLAIALATMVRPKMTLPVDKSAEHALRISDRAYILDEGKVVHTGVASELLADKVIQDRYCAV